MSNHSAQITDFRMAHYDYHNDFHNDLLDNTNFDLHFHVVTHRLVYNYNKIDQNTWNNTFEKKKKKTKNIKQSPWRTLIERGFCNDGPFRGLNDIENEQILFIITFHLPFQWLAFWFLCFDSGWH